MWHEARQALMILLITALTIGSLWLAWSLWSSRRAVAPSPPEALSRTDSLEHPFFPPKAPPTVSSYYTILDIQTNGLIDPYGHPPSPVQISWLCLSQDFLVLSHKTLLVRQDDLGPRSARVVHKVSREQIKKHGITEAEACHELRLLLSQPTILVFHNSSFDTRVLYSLLERHSSPKELQEYTSLMTICTMTFESLMEEREYKYPSLIHLAHRLTDIPLISLADHPITSWRNVCLTRLCLKRLCQAYDIQREVPQRLLVPLGTYLIPEDSDHLLASSEVF